MKDAIVIRDTIISSYDNGNSSLCAQDVDNLRQWKIDNKIFGNTHQLTEEGSQDMQGIGSRLKQAFSKLLTKLDKENYTFRSTKGNWIEDSAQAFINGLQSQEVVIDKVREDYDIMDVSWLLITNKFTLDPNYVTFKFIRAFILASQEL